MKKLILFIGIVIAAAAAFVLLGERRASAPAVTQYEVTASSTPGTPGVAVKDAAWSVFESYISALKAHDLPKVEALSYQLSETCKDSARVKDCYEIMDNAYNFGSHFIKNNLKHVLYDDKQIILFSEYVKHLEGESLSITRMTLYFVRDGQDIKFLSLNPFQGALIVRTEGAATSTMSARLDEMVLDTDGDTLADDVEQCIGQIVASDCVKTDPKKMDTDNDGWWDSVDALFYK
ncbi:hypothetical protein KW796_00570 [Candidatus Parcubacteria bacterium]|nr:hypothetical protein [Candidatus Parcubacteria bacterium]